MKIDDFIAKHRLTLFQSFPEGSPSVPHAIPEVVPAALLPGEISDQYEVYTNADRCIWASKNLSRSQFRVQYSEIVVLTSDWLDSKVDYEILGDRRPRER